MPGGNVKKDVAMKLRRAAQELGRVFSSTDRPMNYNQETFNLQMLHVLSEHVALAEYRKDPTDKLAMAVFYWVNARGGEWRGFFPTDSHVLGFGKLAPFLDRVEAHNLPLNFRETESR